MTHAPTVAPSTKYTIEVPAPVQMAFAVRPTSSSAFKVVPVTPGLFRSWTGRRYLDGVEWHGPVLQSDNTPYTGARACPCAECQRFVRS